MQSAPDAAQEPNQTMEGPSSAPRNRAMLFTVLALAAGVAATVWFEHLRYERFPGYLQARLRTVAAPRDARISEILVTSGSVVTAGQPLLRLKDSVFDQRLETKLRQIESLEIELAQNQARLEVELEWRRKNVGERIFEAKLKCVQALRQTIQAPLELEIDSGRESAWTAPSAVPTVGRSSLIFNDHPLIEQTTGETTSPQTPDSEVRLCLEHIQELERINRELPEKISRSMGVDLSRSRLTHAQAELARLETQKRELTLVAETSGMVGVFLKDVGDHAAAHEVIVQLLDEEQPYLLLQIPSPRISDFAPGTIVELRFPGGIKGKGRVDEIPPQTSPIAGEHGKIGETVITAHVDPVGTLWPNLPFGSVVEVRRKR